MLTGKYLTTTQAGKLLGISRIAVFKRVKSGQIKAEKHGGRYFIPVDQTMFNGEPNKTGKDEIARAVSRGVREYHEVFKWLGSE